MLAATAQLKEIILSKSNASESGKRKIDWFSTLIIIVAFSILFFAAYKSEGLKTAVLTIAILCAFPVSFGIPHFISKLKKEKVELKTVIVLGIYILSLLIIVLIANDRRFVLIFPTMSFLWWFVDWIWKMLKLLILKLFDNGNIEEADNKTYE